MYKTCDDSYSTGTNSTDILGKLAALPINNSPSKIKIPTKICLNRYFSSILQLIHHCLSKMYHKANAIKEAPFENIKHENLGLLSKLQ